MAIQSGPFTVEFLGTPEAGKTTTIKRLRKELLKITDVKVLQEAAEYVPDIFQKQEYKKSMEAHFWMRLSMAQKLIELQASCKPSDILLADRGIIDAFCWNYYFAEQNLMPNVAALHFKQLMSTIINQPQLVIYLKTTPEEAISRRGCEGEIVTYSFVEKFQNSINSFLRFPTTPVFELDTTAMTKDEVFTMAYDKIMSMYSKLF